ncbi:MAG TPA: UdgX family uracil-DNA binding protein [Kofleriaceae bacterium]|nr:UdgX family uracil-DNA binding protein [Kofleriaceae bacterium]
MRSARATRDLAAWRREARGLLAEEVPPGEVMWLDEGGSGLLFGDAPVTPPRAPLAVRVPERFLELAADAVLHRDGNVHELLYRVLWRVAHGERALLDDAADRDVRDLELRARQVHRAIHQMHAFVRFREVEDGRFVAWHDPHHHVLERAVPFFVERFATMAWTIMTPARTALWDGASLSYAPGAPRHAAPSADELEALWRTYYAATFNPARANPALFRSHVPARHRPSMPETADVAELLAGAMPRLGEMRGEVAYVPGSADLTTLRAAAATCRACELCGPATQTVFGEGPGAARMVLVGEQPGDTEDLAGRPFVGPAGEVLDAALARAGIARDEVYVTNAVKHFRFLPRGQKRLHQRPTAAQIRACRPWLAAELRALAPSVIVCLGAVAAQALVGSRFKVTEQRGRDTPTSWARHLIATHHPAAILRVDPAERTRYEDELAADLAAARRLLEEPA